MPFTAADIAKHINGTVIGDGSVILKSFAPAEHAQEGDLTFAESEAYFEKAQQSAAAGILLPEPYGDSDKVLIQVDNVRVAFAKVLAIFVPPPTFPAGVHSSAVVADTATVDPSAHIGPHCVIAEGVTIGKDCVLESLVSVGPESVLGEGCHLFPNVTIYSGSRLGQRVSLHSGTVIGADGFGYVFDQGAHLKIPQIGHVEIGDDVEIGANSTVDRGAVGPTVIGRGTKIDNQVQIAHNVIIGDHCVLVSQVGISGSTQLGNYVTLAGQVGLAGHLKIGNRVTVGAKSGVMHNIPDGETWLGAPAQDARQAKRQIIAAQRLPDMVLRLKQLERRLDSAGKGAVTPPV